MNTEARQAGWDRLRGIPPRRGGGSIDALLGSPRAVRRAAGTGRAGEGESIVSKASETAHRVLETAITELGKGAALKVVEEAHARWKGRRTLGTRVADLEARVAKIEGNG